MNSSQSVCWRRGEVFNYESIWSILHKFCEWNSAGPRDVWDLFGQPGPSAASINTIISRHANLENEQWVNRSTLQTFLGFSAEAVRNLFVRRYTLLDMECRWNRQNLRFCPECIKIGYHSPIHLLPFVSHCPIHHQRLRTECPRCSKQIPYAIPLKTCTPYTCDCGYNFQRTKQSRPPVDFDLRAMHELVIWIDIVNEKSKKLTPLLIRGRSILDFVEDDAATLAIRIQEIEPTILAPRSAFHSSATVNRITRRPGSIVSLDEIIDRDTILLAIYKAIARRISRGQNEETEIKRRGFSLAAWRDDRADRRRIALLAWRMYWEGNRDSLNARPSSLSDGHWKTHFLLRIRNLFDRQGQGAFKCDPAYVLWSAQHIVAAACIGLYSECVRRSAAYSSVSEAYLLANELSGELVPSCIAEYISSPKRSLSLHFWIDASITR